MSQFPDIVSSFSGKVSGNTMNSRRFVQIVLVLMLLALGATTGMTASASEIDNCADFASHQEAVAWFTDHDGSPSNNAGGLDADRDGIPCEHLLDADPIDDGSTSLWWWVAGGTVLVVTAALAGGVMARKRRKHPAGVTVAEPGGYRPVVPEAVPVADIGIVMVTLTADDATEPPAEVLLDIDNDVTTHAWPEGRSRLEIMRDVAAGDRLVTIGTAAQPAHVAMLVTVNRDDVTRLDVPWSEATDLPGTTS